MMNDTQRAASRTAFKRAIDTAKGQVSLASILACSQARISRILAGESEITAEMAARIHRDLRVWKWELRPDLFDAPASKAKAKAKAKKGKYPPAYEGQSESGGEPMKTFGRRVNAQMNELRKLVKLKKKAPRAKSGSARAAATATR